LLLRIWIWLGTSIKLCSVLLAAMVTSLSVNFPLKLVSEIISFCANRLEN
jgi:hypothetical protein